MNEFELLNEYLKASEKLISKLNDMDLIILLNGGKVKVIEKGKEINHIRSVDFSASIDSAPTLAIDKVIL